MKRSWMLVLAVLMACVLALPVAAQSVVRSDSVVDADGSCRVTVSATLVYPEQVTSPVFPVPSGAENVTVNGDPATVYTAAGSRMVSLKDITGGGAGTYTLTIAYHLPAVVSATEEGTLLLSLQLLSGFPYPIDALEATIVLPGDVTGQPVLTGGYYHQTASELVDVSVSGDTVAITSILPLKDHETLTMELPVEETMFPQTVRTARVLGVMDIVIFLSVLLAVGYYLLTMRPELPRRVSRAAAPDGISAGEVAVWMAGGPMDLSMLVVSWAQLGYIRIHVEDTGRVLLHKRMEMGNERSLFENRTYKNLFGRRRVVDGTGHHYAELCRNTRKRTNRLKDVYHPSSGNPLIFRGLCAIGGLLCGVSIAGAVASHSSVLMVLLAAATTVMAVLLQEAGRCLPLRSKLPLWIGLGCAGAWLVLGIWSGEWVVSLLMIVVQFLAGIALGYGGRRTEPGQQALIQLMGLRRFMGSASKKQLQQLLKEDPAYFHELAPYALALGMDKTFARRFGTLRLPECTYLIRGSHRQMTAAEWAALLRTTVDTLDAKARRLPFEKLTGR